MYLMNITEFAKRLNRSVKCIQRWDRDGILKPSYRTPTNRRCYTDEDVFKALGLSSTNKQTKIICYCRVSSNNQKDDMINQREYLNNYCKNNNILNVEFFNDIGSGLNFKRKNFNNIMRMVELGDISEIIITHRDRLVRFGFDWFEQFCIRHNCKITVIDNEILSPEAEMIKDLISIIHVFSCRLYGLRKYKKEISNDFNT